MSFPAWDQAPDKDPPSPPIQAPGSQQPLTAQENQLLTLLRLQAQAQTHAPVLSRLQPHQDPSSGSSEAQSALVQNPRSLRTLRSPANIQALLSATPRAPPMNPQAPVLLPPQVQNMAGLGGLFSAVDPLHNFISPENTALQERPAQNLGSHALDSLDGLRGLVGGKAGLGAEAGSTEFLLRQEIAAGQLAQDFDTLYRTQQQQQQQLFSSLGRSAAFNNQHGVHSFHQSSEVSQQRAGFTPATLAELEMVQQSLPPERVSTLGLPSHLASWAMAGEPVLGQGGLEEVMLGALGIGRSSAQPEPFGAGIRSDALQGHQGLPTLQGLLGNIGERGHESMPQSRVEATISALGQALTGAHGTKAGQDISPEADLEALSSLLQQPSSLQLQALLLSEGTQYPAGFQALVSAAVHQRQQADDSAGRTSGGHDPPGALPSRGAQWTKAIQASQVSNYGDHRASGALPQGQHASPLQKFQPDKAQSSAGELGSLRMPSLGQEVRATISEGTGTRMAARRAGGSSLPMSRLQRVATKSKNTLDAAGLPEGNPSSKRARVQKQSKSATEEGPIKPGHASPEEDEGQTQGTTDGRSSEYSSDGEDHDLDLVSKPSRASGKSLTDEQKRRRKLELNKEAARRMRMRKALKLERLEKQALELQATNWETQRQLREASTKMEELKGSLDALESKIVEVVQEINPATATVGGSGALNILQEQLALLGEHCSPEVLEKITLCLQKP